MRLVKLSSDNNKFKTLNFSPGLNIVAGLQLSKEEKKSINGIGKSLSLKLIHHIFGSSFNSTDEKKFEEFLKEYGTFTLDLLHNNGSSIKIVKDFSKTHYLINDEKVNKTNYPNELKKLFLPIDSKLSFKQVFNTFARRCGGTYYTDPLTQQGRPKEDYYQKYVNLVLLGIDVELVDRRFKNKEELSKLKKAESAFQNYEKSQKINPKDILDKLEVLKKRKKDFVIAENYDDLKASADKKTAKLNSLRDREFSKHNQLARKEITLKDSVHMNINLKKIGSVYGEAKFFFGKKVSKRLEDAQEFHQKLISSRRKSLNQEIKLLKTEIKDIKKSKDQIGKERDQLLKELDKKGAFEEYDSLCDQIRSLETELTEAQQYKNTLKKIDQDKADLDLENAQIKTGSLKYLKDNSEKLESLEGSFRSLVKQFYDNTGGSLEIRRTDNARYLFEIEPNVPRDGSQGISEVKIFCYDTLLFMLNKGLLNFMAHDGCLFSEMDKRQKSMIFKVALDTISNNNLQYFINIGQNSLEEILDEKKEIEILKEKEKEAIEKAIILKLYDKNPESWLFGEEFN